MNIKKSQIIIGSLVTLAILGLLIFLLWPKATLTFRLAPESMSLSFNGKSQTITNGESLSLAPGVYTLTFSRDEFSNETKEIELKNRDKQTIIMALTPQTDAARKIITDNPESAKIIADYKKQQASELAAQMPVQGTGFSIQECPSVKQPALEKGAFCITTTNAASERLARLYIKEQGINPDDLELLVGTTNLMTIMKTPTYKVEVYITDDAKKPNLYITPLNVPFVAYDAPRNEQLESIRTDSLASLEKAGYKHQNYDITFSNIYLGRYNPDHVHAPGDDNNE